MSTNDKLYEIHYLKPTGEAVSVSVDNAQDRDLYLLFSVDGVSWRIPWHRVLAVSYALSPVES